MAKTDKREPATSKSRQESGAKRRPPVEDPAALIGLLSKVVNKLQEHSALKSEEIGLAEWTALRAIAAAPSLPTGGVARQLGVSRQRSTQIVQALGKAGLVMVGRASGDQRKKQLTVTDAGRQKLQRVDAGVGNLLKRIFEEKPKAVGRLGVTLTGLLRKISPAIEKRSAPLPAA